MPAPKRRPFRELFDHFAEMQRMREYASHPGDAGAEPRGPEHAWVPTIAPNGRATQPHGAVVIGVQRRCKRTDAGETVLSISFGFQTIERQQFDAAAGVPQRRAYREGRCQSARGRQEKLCPQPQVRVAFGLVIENPAWLRPSL